MYSEGTAEDSWKKCGSAEDVDFPDENTSRRTEDAPTDRRSRSIVGCFDEQWKPGMGHEAQEPTREIRNEADVKKASRREGHRLPKQVELPYQTSASWSPLPGKQIERKETI